MGATHTETIMLRLRPETREQVERLAQSHGSRPASICRLLILQRLAQLDDRGRERMNRSE